MDGYLPYTATAGGPVLVVSRELAPKWGLGPLDGGYGSHLDYDRACEPRDLINTEYLGVGWVPVEEGAALVLVGDCHTQWLALAEAEGVLFREGSPEISEATVRARLAQVTDWQEHTCSLKLSSGVFYAFDSAHSGASSLEAFDQDAVALECRLAPGTYRTLVGGVDGIDLIRLVPES